MFVRPVPADERMQVEAGLGAADALVLRRSQIELGSRRGEQAPAIAPALGWDDQTVRDVIRAFNERGREGLTRRARRLPPSLALSVRRQRNA